MYNKYLTFISIFLMSSCSSFDKYSSFPVHNQDNISMKGLPRQAAMTEEQYSNVENTNQSTRLIINYKKGSKYRVISAADELKLPLVYELKSMNVIVVAAPKIKAEKYIEYFMTLDGIYGVQEDSMMYLHSTLD